MKRGVQPGMKFGRLLVVRQAPSESHKSRWYCHCDCGSAAVVRSASLLTRNTESCGCLQKELAAKRSTADLLGRRFGRLLVWQRAGSKKNQAMWICRCDCGKEKLISSAKLSGGTRSCGCLMLEVAAKMKTTHGQSKTSEYNTWMAMKQRCYDSNSTSYARYGGRGIAVCKRWRDSFSAFLADMGRKPSSKHSIDRINNALGYEPSNCRWATPSQQGFNRRPYRHIKRRGQ